jgi:6-phosphogluconolactonase (cycloisomerase 2 family)
MGTFKKSFFWVVCIYILALFSASPALAGFLYALNDVDGAGNQIYGFNVNEASGALTPLSGFPLATGGNGSQNLASQRMFYDSLNSRLYVINGGSNTVSAYSVNTTNGALTLLPFSPISLPAGPAQPPNRWSWLCLAVHPSGSPLVVARDKLDEAIEPGQIASFNITPTTATQAAGSPYYTGDNAYPYSCAFSIDGNYVYTGGNRQTAFFAGFSVNTTTGVLTSLSGSPFSSNGFWPLAYATDNQGRLFAYSYNSQGGGQIEVYTTSSGIPSPVSSNPFPFYLDDGIYGILHPSGFYLVADRSYNQVGVYPIAGTGSGTNVTQVSGSPFAAGGIGTNALVLNPAGAFLFATNNYSRNITTFNVNTSTGVLSGATTQTGNTLGNSGYITGIAYVGGTQQPPQPPSVIPTINEWGMIILTVLLGIGAVYYLRKRRLTV